MKKFIYICRVKAKNLLFILLSLIVFASCKKDNTIIDNSIEPTLKDSVEVLLYSSDTATKSQNSILSIGGEIIGKAKYSEQEPECGAPFHTVRLEIGKTYIFGLFLNGRAKDYQLTIAPENNSECIKLNFK